MDLHTWLAFFAAAWAISLSPGPGAIAAMGSGLQHGFARGYFMTFGLVLGIATQVLIVGLGLGALIAAAPLAFTLLKWAGVAYLLWLGIQQWRAPAGTLLAASASAADPGLRVRRRALVLRGWLLNVANPKGTVFMLAVVPQFLQPAAPLAPQYATVAATLMFTDLVVMAGYTALAARIVGALRSAQAQRWLNRSFGGLFVVAAGALALFKRAA